VLPTGSGRTGTMPKSQATLHLRIRRRRNADHGRLLIGDRVGLSSGGSTCLRSPLRRRGLLLALSRKGQEVGPVMSKPRRVSSLRRHNIESGNCGFGSLLVGVDNRGRRHSSFLTAETHSGFQRGAGIWGSRPAAGVDARSGTVVFFFFRVATR